MVMDWLSTAADFAMDAFSFIGGIIDDYIISPVTWFFDGIMDVTDSIISAIEDAVDLAGDIWDGATGWIPGYSQGGIATGSSGGHIAMLHGTEAVVPLPNGKSIPVDLKGAGGGGGGGGNNFNITVNASGITDRSDKRQLAREIGNMIQQEMSRSIGGSTMRGRY